MGRMSDLHLSNLEEMGLYSYSNYLVSFGLLDTALVLFEMDEIMAAWNMKAIIEEYEKYNIL